MDNNSLFARFNHLQDEQWLALLIRSYTEPVINGSKFPAFPDPQLQASFVGSSGQSSLEEAFLFYQDMKYYARQLAISIDRGARILDFGCGWGRNYRFLLKDVSPENLIGIDVDAECVRLCQQCIPMGRFEVCGSSPPLTLKEHSFDIIYAYSVFSHLSEAVQLRWVKEFARILRPGGMLIVTTLKFAHLHVWEKLRQRGDHWATLLSGFELGKAEEQFRSGGFLFCGTGGGGVRSADFYGEAIISPGHVQRAWSPDLQLVAYLDDPVRRPQALIVARKSQ